MSGILNNSDFDVNILHDALTKPNLELTFPLPTDKETYIPLETNEKTSQSIQLLEHFINYFTKINIFEIYNNAEYRYSVHKMNPKFNEFSSSFMKDRLEKSDEKLDEIVYDLVDLELRMNLVKAKDFPRRFKEVKKFMINFYVKENKKNLPHFGNHRFVRLCYITVMKTVQKMFPDGVWVNRDQFSNLYKRYLANPMSIVLLPNHQSHIDYVILHLIMIRFQMSIPTVIAGDNLNVAVFGLFLKKLGGIFIKRSFNNELYTERNLTNYVEFVFLNKIHFEVFIEGTRSRDGKLLLPKYGILKTLASIYHKQRHTESNKSFDMLIQPILITYERVYEADGYLHELIGMDKKQESFANILSNGIKNLVPSQSTTEPLVGPDGYIDNKSRQLSGKLFVKLADAFPVSEYVEDPSNLVEHARQEDVISYEKNVNLKKLGFKILHAINDASYLPESAVVGTTIQTFFYVYGKKEFATTDLIPMMDFLVDVFIQESMSATNRKLLNDMKSLSQAEKVDLINEQVIKFFKFTKVNQARGLIKIENTFELLYYKNLTIHLIIHRCLVSYILLRTLNLLQINKIYYIFTGFLKNEFLFDYDYKPEHSISHILKKYKERGVITENFEIIDREFHQILSAIIQPFIKSFDICVENLIYTVEQFYLNSKNRITEQQLINDSLMLKDYPTTKSLLKFIQKKNSENFENESPSYHIETYNKQYLLSFLFYLNNLRLIKIFKNKSKTKAYVIIKNSKDLLFISQFLKEFENCKTDDISLNYMIDIVDKNLDRVLETSEDKEILPKL